MHTNLHIHDEGGDLRVVNVVEHDAGQISVRFGSVAIYATPAAFADLAADLARIAADYHQRAVAS